MYNPIIYMLLLSSVYGKEIWLLSFSEFKIKKFYRNDGSLVTFSLLNETIEIPNNDSSFST